MSLFQEFKLNAIALTGLSRDALHIYIGLGTFLLVAAALRKPLRSLVPWAAVLLVAVAAELVDMRDDVASIGQWRIGASIHDIVNTLFWPTVLLILMRSRVLSA